MAPYEPMDDTRLASNYDTSAEVLASLATNPDDRIRKLVAQNPRTSTAALVVLSTDPDGYVRTDVADHLNTSLSEIRLKIEYEYESGIGPLLERRIAARHIPITDSEVELLAELHGLLNYLDFVLSSEKQRQYTREDSEATCAYWLEILRSTQPDRAALRTYIRRFGFEHVAARLSVQPSEKDVLFVYGTLRDGGALSDRPQLDGVVRSIGPATTTGRLIDLGQYPGLVDGSDSVVGELYELTDPKSFEVLDDYENYDPASPDDSMYVRRLTTLDSPQSVEAWIYFYNQPSDGRPPVSSGDWIEFAAQKKLGDAATDQSAH